MVIKNLQYRKMHMPIISFNLRYSLGAVTLNNKFLLIFVEIKLQNNTLKHNSRFKYFIRIQHFRFNNSQMYKLKNRKENFWLKKVIAQQNAYNWIHAMQLKWCLIIKYKKTFRLHSVKSILFSFFLYLQYIPLK